MTNENMVSQLLNFSTREQGIDFLESNLKSKKEYVSLANHIDVLCNDNITNIKKRIIEHTIGFRIRAKAIYNGVNNK